MSRLNKQSLYQMATSNNSRFADSLNGSNANGNASGCGPQIIELSAESVVLEPLHPQQSVAVPDGRISGKLSGSTLQQFKADDAITVSPRAQRRGSAAVDISRAEVLRKLGNNGLGLLTSAYLQQTLMRDEEIHTVQQKFYGLHAV